MRITGAGGVLSRSLCSPLVATIASGGPVQDETRPARGVPVGIERDPSCRAAAGRAGVGRVVVCLLKHKP